MKLKQLMEQSYSSPQHRPIRLSVVSQSIVTAMHAMCLIACIHCILLTALPEIRAFQLPAFPVSGRELELYCAVTGTPQATVSWFKDSQLLDSSSNLVISSDNGLARMGISAASQDDGGEYLCVATNVAGSNSVSRIVSLGSMCTK